MILHEQVLIQQKIATKIKILNQLGDERKLLLHATRNQLNRKWEDRCLDGNQNCKTASHLGTQKLDIHNT